MGHHLVFLHHLKGQKVKPLLQFDAPLTEELIYTINIAIKVPEKQ